MNTETAAELEFIAHHKPSKIDVGYIVKGYGSVISYMESVAADEGDSFYLEIPGRDTASGNPYMVEWVKA